MVVAAADQNARLPDAHVLDELKILLGRADPGGDLREFEAQLLAAADSLAVLLAVDEKLRLPDDAVRPAQPAHQLVQFDDLVHRIGVDGLLTVPEGGIADPDFLRHAHGGTAVVELHLWHAFIIIKIPVQVRLRDVLQGIMKILFFQQIGFRADFEHSGLPFVRMNVYNYTRISVFVKLCTKKIQSPQMQNALRTGLGALLYLYYKQFDIKPDKGSDNIAEGVIRGSLPPDDNPQDRLCRFEEYFCAAE